MAPALTREECDTVAEERSLMTAKLMRELTPRLAEERHKIVYEQVMRAFLAEVDDPDTIEAVAERVASGEVRRR